MKIQIKNIAKIESADINLNGLTIIAGENSSGKSTVGKMLFSVVQVLKSTRAESLHISNNLLKKHLTALFTRLNGHKILRQLIRNESIPRVYQIEDMLHEGSLSVDQFIEMIEGILKSTKEVSPRTIANIRQDLRNIELTVSGKENRAAIQASSIQSMIETEFINSVCSNGSVSSSVSLDVSDSDKAFISFELENNNVDKVRTTGREFLEDATYVESPLYLHMLESLNYSLQYVELEQKPTTIRGMIPTHIKDFVSKMMYAKSYTNSFLYENTDMINRIQNEIGGEFEFDEQTSRLQFRRDGNVYSPINTASGIKTFGVLQLLLQSEVIGPNKLLIWDEPENHLHPRWQVAFAEILVLLSKNGIPILVSTHSPYFVQGIRYFSAKYDLEKYTNYYLAEEQPNNLSIIKEVTTDLNQVFSKLAEPLGEIMNVDLVRRESMKK